MDSANNVDCSEQEGGPRDTTQARPSSGTDKMRDDLAAAHREHGNAHFAAGEWHSAVREYSAALKLAAHDAEQEAVLLSNRAAALIRWADSIRGIPAAHSESRALYGHDPTHLAQLALKDALKAATLRPQWHKPLSRQGSALFLLERYEEAEAALLEALLLAPGNAALLEDLNKVQGVLREQGADVARSEGGAVPEDPACIGEAAANSSLHRASTGSGDNPLARISKRQRRLQRDLDDLDCILCLKLLYQPVTTPCGHTFCKSCISRALDHSTRCPMCRTVLHVGSDLPVTITLKNLISRAFPEEWAERQREEGAAAPAAANAATAAPATLSLPLFVMSTLLPGEKMALNIFEPRYRLMIRRCMEGSRRFGMAEVYTGHRLLPVACEVEITDCQPQPDGRFYLEVVGRRRVTIHDHWELDGYRVASAQVLSDLAPSGADATDAGGAASVAALAARVEQLSDSWLERIRMALAGRRIARVVDLLERVGDKPPATNYEALSFWAHCLLLASGNGGDGGISRASLLQSRDTAARLESAAQQLSARLEGSGSCRLM